MALAALVALSVVVGGQVDPASATARPAVAAVAAAGIGAVPQATVEHLDDGGRVLVVAVPRLTWDLVDSTRTPTLAALARDGAVASMSVRTVGPVTTSGEGYLTIGAGNRATVDPPDDADAVAPEEPYGGATGAEVYRRLTGDDPAGATVLQLSDPVIQRRNDRLHYGAEPGALGTALASAGRSSAVVANADVVDADGSTTLQRQAALAMMDGAGRVAGGQVMGLAHPDAAAPGGSRLDGDAVVAAAGQALAGHDVVLVELSDLDRADAERTRSTPVAAAAARVRALADTDATLSRLLALVDPAHDLVVVVAPSAPRGKDQLTVLALQGPGVHGGRVQSATTRRAGYVTLPDIGPTVLHALGVPVPDAMNGTLMSVVGGHATPSSLARDNVVALFRDRAVGPVSVVYIVFQVLVYAAAAVVLTRWRGAWRHGVAVAALAVLAMPLVVFASGAVPVDHLGVPGYVLAVLAASGALAGAAWTLRGRHVLAPPLALVGAGLLLQWGDIATGGRLQLDTPFGYSPIVAGRFAGFGNLAFALVAMAAIVVATALWGLVGAEPRHRRWAIAAVVFVLGVTLLLDGAPFAGSDVGGVLSALPTFALTVAILARWHVDVRRAAAVVAGTVGLVVVFALVDLARPEQDRTHLGRFAQRVGDGEAGQILRRKATANLHILTSSVWAYVIPVALAFLVFLTMRRRGFLARLFVRVEGTRACVIGGLVAGVLGFALNDSGVAVPAMMFGTLLPYLAYLVVRTGHGDPPRRQVGPRPDPAPADGGPYLGAAATVEHA